MNLIILVHWIKKKIARANGKFNSSSELISLLSEKFSAQLPKLLFISLPLVALLLAGLYFRRKQWGYADHAILTLHLFSATFLILLLDLLLGHLFTALHWVNINKWVSGFFAIVFPIYYFASLKKFYQQTTGKTLLKTGFLLLGSFMVFLLVYILLLAFLFITLH